FTYFGLFSPLVSLCYVITEFGSILENLRKMGTEVPSILTKGFASLKKTVEAHADAAIPDESEEKKPPDEEE
ncbi:MAG: phage holin family protein, partial [Clostridia bacterium]|nr:phage holin family protein [Clostridia bacterium]